MNHKVASPSDCVNIIECIYTNEMAIASPGNIILWDHCCYVFCHSPKCKMQCVTLLLFLPMTLKTTVLSRLVTVGKHRVNVLESY